MAIDNEKAQELGNALAFFVRGWVAENMPGQRCGNEILSVMVNQAGYIIARNECPKLRAQLFENAVKIMLACSDAPVMVSTYSVADEPDAYLAGLKPAGSA